MGSLTGNGGNGESLRGVFIGHWGRKDLFDLLPLFLESMKGVTRPMEKLRL